MSVIIIFAAVLHILIAIFVLCDAKKRNMDSLVWGIIALIGICFVGLIIYVISRDDIKEYRCADCGETVGEYDDICKKCGAVLNAICPKCGKKQEYGWKVCPVCNEKIQEKIGKKVRMIKSESHLFSYIIVSMIVLIGLYAVFSMKLILPKSYVYDARELEIVKNITVDEINNSTELKKWTSTFKDDKPYMIVNKKKGTVYMYLNKDETFLKVTAQMESYNDDKDKLCFYANTVKNTKNHGFSVFLYDGKANYDVDQEFVVYIDDKEVECEITYTTEDINMDTWKEKK